MTDALRERRSPLATDRSARDGSSEPRAPQPSPLGKSLRHVSPRKFHQLQVQQRAAVLRALPLSPLSARVEGGGDSKPAAGAGDKAAVYEPRDPVPWNPAWLREAPNASRSDTKTVDALLRAAGALGASSSTRVGAVTLDAWLQSYEHEFLVYESLEHFVQVKLPEALAFCDKMARESRGSASAVAKGQQLRPSSRFHVRLRIAVFAHLVERTVFALAQSAALSHAKKPLFQARQEIFRAMFADYDERLPGDEAGGDRGADASGLRPQRSRRRQRRNSSDSGPRDDDDDVEGSRSDRQDDSDLSGSTSGDDSDAADEGSTGGAEERSAPRRTASRSQRTQARSRFTSTLYGPTAAPRTLAFFVTKVPFALKLREDSQRRALRFKRNQVVLRRIVQSLYRSLGSVFHAWKLLVRQKKEERLNNKGAQLTAMVVQQRGLVRSVFVEWSKATLRSRITEMRSRELEMRQQHEQVVADLYKEVFLLRERNRELQLEVAENQRCRPVPRKLRSPAPATVDVSAPVAPEVEARADGDPSGSAPAASDTEARGRASEP